MSNEEKERIIKAALEKQDVFILKSVMNVNHKPHPYTIGPKHIEYASEHWSGMLGEEVMRKVQCAHPNCRLSFDEHTYDNVAFLSIIRNVTNDEANDALKSLVDTIGEEMVDGFAFVESKFKITKD